MHAKYDDDALIFGMRCILEGVYARTGERFETFDAAYAALAGDVVLSLDRATVAALAAARVSPAAPKGGRTPDGGRTDSGALAGRESPKSSVDGVDLDGEFGAIPKPGGIVWNAMQAKYTPEAFARIIFTWGESKGRASMASREHSEVGLPKPERQEKGGKPPAEFHAKPDQLGQFATDWLYQAQLWVQAESFLKPVPKVITYLRGDALAWWRDVGDLAVGPNGSWLDFKTAFLKRFVKPSDSLKARVALQACAQGDLSVEAFASKFRGIANRIVVGNPVDRTTQATWFLRGLNGRIMSRLQGSVEHTVMMDVDLVIAAAVNIEANLDVAAKQADGKGKERRSWGKGSEGQGPSGEGQANNIAKRDAEGNRKQPGRRPTAEGVCHKCKRTGHWARECPLNKGDKVGLPSTNVTEQVDVCCDAGTMNAVRVAPVLTGANAVPVPSAKARQIAERVIAKRKDSRGSFGDNAVACPIEPPLVEVAMNALSKDGLTMLFFAHVAGHQGGTRGQR